MDWWHRLHETISTVVEDRRIGSPRALRVTVHLRGITRDRRSLASMIAESADQWFDGNGELVKSAESPNSETHMVSWPSGSSALISVSSGENGQFGGTLMLMGTRGSLYHDIDGASS